MEALDELEQLTLQIVADIHEATAEQLEVFLDQRESIIENILARLAAAPDDGSNLKQVQRVLSYDPCILNRMEELKNEANQGVGKFNRARIQRNGYGGAYGEDNSMFFDVKN